MEIVKIPFSGITRNTDDGICPDGECVELINARVENNAIEPVNKPILLKNTVNEYKSISYHASAKRFIGITPDGIIYEISKDLSTESPLPIDFIINKIEFIGNIMIAFTEDGFKYFLFKNDGYYYLGNFPELPEIKVSAESEVFVGDQDVYNTNTSDYNSKETMEILDQMIYGQYLKLMSKANKKGYFINGTIIRAAFRLFDGSYIKHSPLIFVPINESSLSKQVTLNVTSDEHKGEIGNKTVNFSPLSRFFDSAKGFAWGNGGAKKLDWYIRSGLIGIKPLIKVAPFDIGGWKDLILGIDVFCSPSILLPPSTEENFVNANKDYTIPNFKEQIEETSLLSQIATIELSGQIIYSTSDVSKDALAIRDRMNDDNLTHNMYIPQNSYVYNSKLHIWSLKQKLFNWYDISYIYGGSNPNGTKTVLVEIYVTLSTNQGDTILKKQGYIPDGVLTGLIMYPDSRAYRIGIRVGNKFRSFALKRHSFLNVGYYLNLDEDKGFICPINTSNWGNWSDNVFETSNYIDENYTTLKVSNLNNPFFFPSKTTYQFQAEIVGLQSNTTALSQGQFGQHPLYVFCKDGVFAMQVGVNGDVTYTSSTPISRDACISPYICGIDSAVVFLTDRGAMMVSGTDIRCFSESMDGYLPSCVISSPVIPKILKIAGMDVIISSVTFRDYIRNAKVGYNYQQSEIIIANPSFPYSYVYNMKSGTWHKISLQISNFVNAYPDTYVIVQEDYLMRLYDLNNNYRSVTTMALLTRPIKMGTNAHKRILQTALRGIVKRALSDLYLRGEPVMFRGESLDIFTDIGFYILGSNDTEHFFLVSGKESIVDIRDLVTKMNKSKAYKYFMIALVGGVRSDISLNYIEVIADESFGNRLR